MSLSLLTDTLQPGVDSTQTISSGLSDVWLGQSKVLSSWQPSHTSTSLPEGRPTEHMSSGDDDVHKVHAPAALSEKVNDDPNGDTLATPKRVPVVGVVHSQSYCCRASTPTVQ